MAKRTIRASEAGVIETAGIPLFCDGATTRKSMHRTINPGEKFFKVTNPDLGRGKVLCQECVASLIRK